MNATTRDRLRAINLRFYAERAAEWSRSREHPWPGWTRVCDAISSRDAMTVLDLGCGNGRFAAFLAASDQRARISAYLGLDVSEPLLDLARGQLGATAGDAAGPARFRFEHGDVLAEQDAPWPRARFDLVVAFGLMHHVPGLHTRSRLFRSMAERVAPGGLLAITLWRFAETGRFRDKRVPWPEYNARAEEPIDIAELEAGDHLLHFGDPGALPRYCHAVDDVEADAWIRGSDLRPVDDFRADGRSGDLNRYLVLARPGAD